LSFPLRSHATYLRLEFHSAIELTHQPSSNFAFLNVPGSSVRSLSIHSGQRRRIRGRGLHLRLKSTLAPLCSSYEVGHFLIGQRHLAVFLYHAGIVGIEALIGKRRVAIFLYHAGIVGNEANSLGFRCILCGGAADLGCHEIWS